MSAGATRSGLLAFLALAGCAMRADVVQTDRALRGMIQEQRKQLQSVQREVERLRADVEEGGPRRGRGGASTDERLTSLEQRIEQLERGTQGEAAAPLAEDIPPGATTTPPAVASTPRPAARPPVEEDAWRKEVAGEQGAAGAVSAPERAEYLRLLDGVAAKDCARSEPQLNGFATTYKSSPLADNAIYWAARCYALRGDSNQAIQKFYDVVTRYPKGDKAPAALWAQGNLFLAMGDSPDARITFSKLIRDYPSTDEATRARQKLSQLEN